LPKVWRSDGILFLVEYIKQIPFSHSLNTLMSFFFYPQKIFDKNESLMIKSK
jgi:hypothetical protein